MSGAAADTGARTANGTRPQEEHILHVEAERLEPLFGDNTFDGAPDETSAGGEEHLIACGGQQDQAVKFPAEFRYYVLDTDAGEWPTASQRIRAATNEAMVAAALIRGLAAVEPGICCWDNADRRWVTTPELASGIRRLRTLLKEAGTPTGRSRLMTWMLEQAGLG